MNNKTISLVATGLLLVTSTAFAAKGSSQNGFFLGAEVGTNKVKYTYNKETLTKSALPFDIMTGARYYKGKFGVGVKAFAGLDTYSNTFDKTTVKAEGLRYGGEGQLYFDFKQFAIKSSASSVGLTLGVGYENIYYSSIDYNTPRNTYITYVNYSDTSLYYTGALHFTLGPNRLEVGYKKVDYAKVTKQTSEINQSGTKYVGFNPTDSIFATYSLSF